MSDKPQATWFQSDNEAALRRAQRITESLSSETGVSTEDVRKVVGLLGLERTVENAADTLNICCLRIAVVPIAQ